MELLKTFHEQLIPSIDKLHYGYLTCLAGKEDLLFPENPKDTTTRIDLYVNEKGVLLIFTGWGSGEQGRGIGNLSCTQFFQNTGTGYLNKYDQFPETPLFFSKFGGSIIWTEHIETDSIKEAIEASPDISFENALRLFSDMRLDKVTQGCKIINHCSSGTRQCAGRFINVAEKPEEKILAELYIVGQGYQDIIADRFQNATEGFESALKLTRTYMTKRSPKISGLIPISKAKITLIRGMAIHNLELIIDNNNNLYVGVTDGQHTKETEQAEEPFERMPTDMYYCDVGISECRADECSNATHELICKKCKDKYPLGLCERCVSRPATVKRPEILNNKTTRNALCVICAEYEWKILPCPTTKCDGYTARVKMNDPDTKWQWVCGECNIAYYKCHNCKTPSLTTQKHKITDTHRMHIGATPIATPLCDKCFENANLHKTPKCKCGAIINIDKTGSPNWYTRKGKQKTNICSPQCAGVKNFENPADMMLPVCKTCKSIVIDDPIVSGATTASIECMPCWKKAHA